MRIIRFRIVAAIKTFYPPKQSRSKLYDGFVVLQLRRIAGCGSREDDGCPGLGSGVSCPLVAL